MIEDQGIDRSTDRFARLAEPLLTPSAAAGLLSVKTSWIYDAVRDGRLPCVRIGRHVRFLRSDLEKFVAAQRSGLHADS